MNITSHPLLMDQLVKCIKRLLPEASCLQLQQVETTADRDTSSLGGSGMKAHEREELHQVASSNASTGGMQASG